MRGILAFLLACTLAVEAKPYMPPRHHEFLKTPKKEEIKKEKIKPTHLSTNITYTSPQPDGLYLEGVVEHYMEKKEEDWLAQGYRTATFDFLGVERSVSTFFKKPRGYMTKVAEARRHMEQGMKYWEHPKLTVPKITFTVPKKEKEALALKPYEKTLNVNIVAHYHHELSVLIKRQPGNDQATKTWELTDCSHIHAEISLNSSISVHYSPLIWNFGQNKTKQFLYHPAKSLLNYQLWEHTAKHLREQYKEDVKPTPHLSKEKRIGILGRNTRIYASLHEIMTSAVYKAFVKQLPEEVGGDPNFSGGVTCKEVDRYIQEEGVQAALTHYINDPKWILRLE